ncbi:MAG: hypothetical protein NC453_19470 [Muribaculum sp.]|nr:hypothetical protein [Muribaculum sp.]
MEQERKMVPPRTKVELAEKNQGGLQEALENVTADVEKQQLSTEESPAQPKNVELTKQLVAELKAGTTLNVSEAEAAGIIFLYVDGFNRSVNKKHVEQLKTSARENGFLQPIEVIALDEYLRYYPDRKLANGDRVYDNTTTDCYRAMVILDGQHRYGAESQLMLEKNYKPTLSVVCVDLKGLDPDKWMITINTQSRNWTSKDRTGNILSRNPDEDTNIYLANKWQNEYGMGERAAYGLIELDDCYKKSLQVDYMNNPENGLPWVLEGTEDKRKRGIELLHAFEVGFRSVPKMLKNMSAVNLAIEIYKAADDKNKEAVVMKIKLFFMSLDQDVAKKANDVSAVAEKYAILKAEWKKVSQKLNSELSMRAIEEEALMAEKEWAVMKEAQKKAAEEKAAKAKERKSKK